MPPKTVFDVVKSHIRLPINRDYGALKQVLREWLAFSTQVPLQEKPTFPAELIITITRSATPSKDSESSNTSSIFSSAKQQRAGHSAAPPPRSRRWSLWRSRSSSQEDTSVHDRVRSSAAANDGVEEPPFVYRKVVPLQVWTSVLPWEMQRGLSFTNLTQLAEAMADTATEDDTGKQAGRATPPSQPQQQQKPGQDTEEEDPYGVVTSRSSAASPPPPSTSTPSLRAFTTASASAAVTSALSITRPAPAMLFLCDVPATRTHGIGFWSGAICQPIDVLFVAPTLPSSVGPSSASFQQLRQQEARAAVEESRVSHEALTRFFPLQEMTPANPSSNSAVTFRVQSFSHLDPLPASIHPSRLQHAMAAAGGAQREIKFTAEPDAPYPSAEEAPRYVLEAPRHTLQPAVAAALRESQRLVETRSGLAGEQGENCRSSSTTIATESENAQDVSIDLTVNFSDALREDVFAKAQLCVEYASLLEDAVAHYARQLSTDRTAAAVAADPLESEADGVVGSGSVSDAVSDTRPMKVWMSEHEYVWMTPAELRRSAAAGGATTTRETKSMDTDDEGGLDDDRVAADAHPTAPSVAAASTDPSLVSRPADVASAALAEAAARAVGAQPAQPGAVSPARSISLQSPMLTDEAEGRPSYLAPSFHGRHESSALQSSAVVLSADKLARYPRTHSHMPQLPPIDYELYDLCLRLGVGQETVLYHFHARIMREWQQELRRRRGRTESSSPIPPADVQRMVALVRDRSLQLAPELVSLVEAVAAA